MSFTSHFRLHWPLLATIVSLAWSPALSQQGSISVDENSRELPTTRLKLAPMAAPLPAMKYELLPKAIDRRPGNGAVHYGKVKSEQNAFFSSLDINTKITMAQEKPLGEIKDLDFLINLGQIYGSLQRGARCQNVDWQLPLRDQFFAGILLPEVQESRQFARILQGRARVQLARGDFDGAIDTLQTAMGLARHVGQGETLINGLVGLAMAQMSLSTVQEWVAQPGAPNLYWALAILPSPLIDLRPGLESEQFSLYWTEPEWLQPEKMEGDEHFWRSELNRLWDHIKGVSEGRLDDNVLTASVIRGYPSAKLRLVQRGFNPDEVEKMPVARAILLDVLHQYNCNRDAEHVRAMQALRDLTELPPKQGTTEHVESLPISQQISVASYSSIVASAKRVERQVAVLQVVEALRMHAAKTGKLPTQLSEIKLVHVPGDPSTGKPFEYEYKEDHALISSSHLNVPIRLEVRF